jgi:isoleucyl-tRNA synthetase
VDYAIIEIDDAEYVIAVNLAEKYFPDTPGPKAVLKGKDLVGQEYIPLFDFYKDKTLGKNAWKIIPGNFVTTEEGTGIVHINPAFGEEDYQAGKEHGLAFFQHVDESGKFKEELKELAGKTAQKSDPEIIELMEKEGLLHHKEKYEHDYPHCWRCDTPLMYYAVQSWLVNVGEHRDKLVKLNENIQWVPNRIKEGRFGEWISHAKDWALSRKRYWGTPLPIWKCDNKKCSQAECIGSVEELKEKATRIPEKLDLHKPAMDRVKLKCSKCGSEMTRVEEVIDCWYDSGSAIFAQLHYPFENKELFEKYFPYHFVAEAQDQTRGWFYTMHVLGALLFDSQAYNSVICAGLMVDKDGEKMSKSKGNMIAPMDAFEKAGVDAVRLQLLWTPPGNEIRFGYETINETIKPFLNILWNSLWFSQKLIEKGKSVSKPALEKEDEWILSRLASARNTVTEGLESYFYNQSVQGIVQFINEDFSRTYIKLVRERAKENDEAVSYVFYQVWDTLGRLLAPFAPYLSEEIYESAGGKEKSVHASKWPKEMKRNKALEKEMEFIQKVISAGLFLREKQKINVRRPLQTLNVKAKKENRKAIENLSFMILNQLNVKQITINGKNFEASQALESDEETIVSLNIKTTPELNREGTARELIRKINGYRKERRLAIGDRIKLFVKTDNEVMKQAIEEHSETIKQKVLADTMAFDVSSNVETKEITIKDLESGTDMRSRIGVQKMQEIKKS